MIGIPTFINSDNHQSIEIPTFANSSRFQFCELELELELWIFHVNLNRQAPGPLLPLAATLAPGFKHGLQPASRPPFLHPPKMKPRQQNRVSAAFLEQA